MKLLGEGAADAGGAAGHKNSVSGEIHITPGSQMHVVRCEETAALCSVNEVTDGLDERSMRRMRGVVAAEYTPGRTKISDPESIQ
jgi:hypothetical protein